jgi:hypothetical protein
MLAPTFARPVLLQRLPPAQCVHCFKARMLKITIHDSPTEFRLELEGRLAGPWVAEAEHCWRTGESTFGRRRFAVDLRGVEFVDAAGRELLAAMRAHGAHFRVTGPMMRSLIEEISAELYRP